MIYSEKLDKILPALAKVKSNLGKVTKSANNPFFKSKYADLNTHLEVVESVLELNGLILLQPVSSNELGNFVESIIFHSESGQYVSSKMQLVGETDMQKAGSAITYARRYTLGSLLSMQAVDDDGNDASLKSAKSSKSSSASTAKSATSKSSNWRKPKKEDSEPKSDAGLGDI